MLNSVLVLTTEGSLGDGASNDDLNPDYFLEIEMRMGRDERYAW
jgi:hypothetical protein